MTSKCDLEEILSVLPSKFRDAIIEILLEIQNEIVSVDCDTVTECETLTSLSEFTQEGTQICITYTDEDGVSTERCFDIETTINEQLEQVDAGCITTPTLWNQMSLTDKFQSIIDTICSCCPSTSTTTTTTEP